MTHLKDDEIIEFVSLTELNSETIELTKTVNGHIRDCRRCRELVRSFQLIRDEFSRLGRSREFKSFIAKKVMMDNDFEKEADYDKTNGGR